MRSALPALLLSACTGEPSNGADSGSGPGDSADSGDSATSANTWTVSVRATLDGVPTAGIDVYQGGVGQVGTTDASGLATVELSLAVEGPVGMILSHPEARTKGQELSELPGEPLTFELVRFSPTDNAEYRFGSPGTPGNADSTEFCGHCHTAILADWYDSPHREAASNPKVWDLYTGAAAAFSSQASCEAAGGAWLRGSEPGTGATAERCFLGDGVLPDLNPEVCADGPCTSAPAETGACADCHAPGIDGELGGRDLFDATGVAYDAGVHCDVCHKTESIDLGAEAGVAGRMGILRPSEPSPTPTLGIWAPLSFGPFADVANLQMGSVPRGHFQDATICAGCHQLDSVPLAGALDAERWPEGRLPMQSTYAEWADGPLNPSAPCQSCHMPPDPTSANAADLGGHDDAALPGIASGWHRAAGSVRRHVWYGPNSDVQPMLPLAASLSLNTQVVGGQLEVAATVKNVGAGHAIPTGEAMRQILLRVEASCDGVALTPSGGQVVPDYGGAAESRDAGSDWALWPEAAVGDVLVVLERTGDWLDYTGPLRFGDGSFTAAERGIEVEELRSYSRVLAVGADGALTLDAPLAVGTVIRRLRGEAIPTDGATAAGLAGLPGWAFARVLTDAAGTRMVPHFRAVDVESDNRLVPQASFTSEHRFAATCAEPTAHAVLLYRDAPLELAAERGWALTERVMAEVWR